MSAPQLRRTDAKAFFANERTFLHWMNTSVTIGSIAAALLGISGHGHKHWGSEYAARAIFVRVISLIMMAAAIGMTVFAAISFRKRGDALLNKLDAHYNSKTLPIVLTATLITALSITFVGTLVAFENDG